MFPSFLFVWTFCGGERRLTAALRRPVTAPLAKQSSAATREAMDGSHTIGGWLLPISLTAD